MHINHPKFAATMLAGILVASCAPTSSNISVSEPVQDLQTSATEQPATADVPTGTSSVQDSGDQQTPIAQQVTASVGAAEPVAVEVAENSSTIRYFTDANGLAIRGTDPVAYFTQSRAVAGSPEFTYIWGNATWQFASAENRDRFAANPEQYAPQYGGFCAWAVSQGYTASIDPNAWRIVDSKLYLNYNQGVKRRWERDIPGNISKANANWPGVLSGF